jgi:hypothetical protein
MTLAGVRPKRLASGNSLERRVRHHRCDALAKDFDQAATYARFCEYEHALLAGNAGVELVDACRPSWWRHCQLDLFNTVGLCAVEVPDYVL